MITRREFLKVSGVAAAAAALTACGGSKSEDTTPADSDTSPDTQEPASDFKVGFITLP